MVSILGQSGTLKHCQLTNKNRRLPGNPPGWSGCEIRWSRCHPDFWAQGFPAKNSSQIPFKVFQVCNSTITALRMEKYKRRKTRCIWGHETARVLRSLKFSLSNQCWLELCQLGFGPSSVEIRNKSFDLPHQTSLWIKQSTASTWSWESKMPGHWMRVIANREHNWK